MIVLTMADRRANDFVSLAAFEWRDQVAFDRAWTSVPEAPAPDPSSDVAFLADRHDPRGHTDDKYITAEWIEEVTGRNLEEMIAEGRAENQAQLAMLRGRRKQLGTKQGREAGR
jgi:hypothetical protein